ncbi:MAG: glycoside hydrolase family 3 N-terminal domain-containing protein [Bacteroidales bacterium]
MKRLLKIVLYLVSTLVGLLILLIIILIIGIRITTGNKAKESMKLALPESVTITIDGYSFPDLNRNGKLDIYEDSRRSESERAADLLSQMTLEEKAGTMFITMIGMKNDGSISEGPAFSDLFSLLIPGTSNMVFTKKMNHFNILSGAGKREMATWYNNLQKLSLETRLGIPFTVGSDPRNHFSNNPLASNFAGDMSLFPEPLGLAATGDSALVYNFADMARREYISVGIRLALHPQVDLATEPRWGRMNYTFGEDAELSSKLAYAYIKGFQGDTLGGTSVACMTKHFAGGGPQKEGIDPHFKVQKGQVYPGNNFEYHLIPFEAALKAGTAEIMPYYGIPTDITSENVGFSFNREMIDSLLRKKMGFKGIVCTDWGIITDWKLFGSTVMPARAWGMENATTLERVEKVLNAGVDQFGGEMVPELVVTLVKEGKIKESRIDSSVIKLLKMKFRLGLFENRFVDPDQAEKIVGCREFVEAGELAQRKSIVMLKNDTVNKKPVLPLKKGIKIYVVNIDPVVASEYGELVRKPGDADIAVIRIKAPKQKLEGAGPLGMLFSSGDLDFKGKEKEYLVNLIRDVPTIVDIYLDRPAVIPEIAASCKGLFADFGVDDNAILDVVFGKFNPQGKLPVELPSSMDAVKRQKEDLPYDSGNPIFPYGFGLRY